MTISYEQQRQDLESASRATTGRAFGRFRMYLLVVIALCVVAAVFSKLGHNDGNLSILFEQIKPLFFLVLLLVVLFWLSPKLAARKFVLRNVRWFLDDSGIRLENDVATTELKWEAFQKYSETRREFLLYVHKNQAHFIPKRVLSEAELQELRDLLARHLKK